MRLKTLNLTEPLLDWVKQDNIFPWIQCVLKLANLLEPLLDQDSSHVFVVFRNFWIYSNHFETEFTLDYQVF